MPPAVKDKYNLQLPEYPGQQQCVRIGGQMAKIAGTELAAMRLTYDAGALDEAELDADPIVEFGKWLNRVISKGVCLEPNAMTLATANPHGAPSARVVLLKGFDERGFVFYTNYDRYQWQFESTMEAVKKHTVLLNTYQFQSFLVSDSIWCLENWKSGRMS